MKTRKEENKMYRFKYGYRYNYGQCGPDKQGIGYSIRTYSYNEKTIGEAYVVISSLEMRKAKTAHFMSFGFAITPFLTIIIFLLIYLLDNVFAVPGELEEVLEENNTKLGWFMIFLAMFFAVPLAYGIIFSPIYYLVGMLFKESVGINVGNFFKFDKLEPLDCTTSNKCLEEDIVILFKRKELKKIKSDPVIIKRMEEEEGYKVESLYITG